MKEDGNQTTKFLVMGMLVLALVLASAGYFMLSNPKPDPTPTSVEQAQAKTVTATPRATASVTLSPIQGTPTKVRPTATATPKPTATATPTPTPTSTSTPTPTPTPTFAAPVGFACLGTFGFGVTCLDEDGWHAFNEANAALSSDQVKDMALCPDNRLLVLHTYGVSAYDGRTWKEYKSEWGTSSGNAIACDSQDQIWVAHFGGVSVLRRNSWKTYPSSDLAKEGAANELVNDIAAAGQDIWVTTANSVAKFEGRKWEIYQEGQGLTKRYFFGPLTLDQAAHPWAAYSQGLLAFDGETWHAYPNNDLLSVKSLTLDFQDRVWVGTMGRGVYVFEDGGWLHYDTQNSGLSHAKAQTVAMDAQGRMWIGTAWGVSILAGETWTVYRMDNADLVDNDITSLVISEGGPPLPELQEKAPGSLSGQVVHIDGTPAENATVEVCLGRVSTLLQSEIPCTRNAYVQSTQTDAEGHFVLEDLPIGHYAVTFKGGDEWKILTSRFGLTSKNISVKPGEDTYLSELILEEE